MRCGVVVVDRGGGGREGGRRRGRREVEREDGKSCREDPSNPGRKM